MQRRPADLKTEIEGRLDFYVEKIFEILYNRWATTLFPFESAKRCVFGITDCGGDRWAFR